MFTAAAAVAFCIGTLVLALILDAFGDLPNSWAYKSCFVTQYGVTGIAILFLPFVPETPTWLVMRGRHDDALKAQRRLGSSEEQAKGKIANIKYTLRKAAEESEGVTYAELFRKSNLRRTIVACMPLTFQAWSGVFWVIGYFIYYAQLAGYSTSMSYKLNITQQVLSTTGNICSVSASPLTCLVPRSILAHLSGDPADGPVVHGGETWSTILDIVGYDRSHRSPSRGRGRSYDRWSCREQGDNLVHPSLLLVLQLYHRSDIMVGCQ